MRRQGRKLFTDRSTFSSLVRSVRVQETDGEHRRQALASLREYITRTENIKTVREQADSLLLVVCEIFQDRCSSDFKLQCAQLAGILIVLCGNDSRRQILWLFNRLETRTNDEVKGFILSAILQTLQHGGRSAHIEQLLPMTMNSFQTVLEIAETPEMLVTVTNTIHFMAQNHPHIFSAHFKDTVDILVGWHIDVTQKLSLIKYCAESLVSLRPFWLEDMNFTIHLLSQFVEDLEAYAEDLASHGGGSTDNQDSEKLSDQSDIPSQELCKDKIMAFLGVFMTVVRSVGDALSPQTTPTVKPSFIARVFSSIIQSAETVQKFFPDSNILYKANACIAVICEAVKSQLGQCQTNLLEYVQNQLDTLLHQESATQKIASTLNVLQKICRYSSSGMSAELVQGLLGPESTVRMLRHLNNKQLVHLLLSVYQSLLCIKDVTILELVYSLILGDLEVAFNVLLSCSKISVPCSFVTNNPFIGMTSTLTKSDAELIATFDLAALTEIGRTKSLLGVWALSPSVFELLTSHILPKSWIIARSHPTVHYTLLHALFTHCESHGYFISSSQGIAIPSGRSEHPGGLSKTGQFFMRILNLLTDLLPNPALIADSRRLVIHWLSNIIVSLQHGGYYHVFITPQFVSTLNALLHLAFDVELDIVIAVCECLQLALPTPNLPIAFMERVFSICKTHLASTNPTVTTSYSHLLNHMPCHVLSRVDIAPLSRIPNTDKTAGSSDVDPQKLQMLPRARRSHMTKQVNETFLWSDARTVLAFLLLGEKPRDHDWLAKIYHNCQRPQAGKNRTDNILETTIDHNLAVQCFWATWEAAQFCVISKLRTPIGKPQDTFRAIEGALKDFVAGIHPNDETRTVKAFSAEYSSLQLRPLLLLQFMEHLEKLVYNATEGCAVSLPLTNKSVKTFFRTNMSTCKDWFNMMRPVLYAVAINCDQYAFAYKQAAGMIKDCTVKGTTAEPRFEDVVCKAAYCSAKLGDAQGIVGLQTWCESTAQRKFPWLSALVKHAERNFESCATETIQALKDYINIGDSSDLPPILNQKGTKMSETAKVEREGKDGTTKNGPTIKLMTRESTNVNNSNPFQGNHAVVSFLANEVVDIYLTVGDYKSALEWQDAVKHLKTKAPDGITKNLNLNEDFNAVKALGSFQDFDFKTAQEHLDLVPKLTALQNPLENCDIERSDVYNLLSIRKTSWLLIIESLCRNHLLGCAASPLTSKNGISGAHPEMSKILDMFEKAGQLQRGGLKLNLLEWPSLTSDLASMSQLTSMMTNTVQTMSPNFLLPLGAELDLHPSEQNLKALIRAVVLTSYQLHLQRMRGNSALELEIAVHLTELHLAVASLARKLGNLKLADNYLSSEVMWMTNGPSRFKLDRSSPQKPLVTVMEEGTTKDLSTLVSFRLERECCKLFHSSNQKPQAWEQMASIILKYTTLSNPAIPTGADYLRICELNSRSLCGLVKWLTVDYRSAVPYLKQARGTDLGDMSNLAKSLFMLLEMEQNGSLQGLGLGMYIQQVPGSSGVGASPAINENDAVCGRLLHLATMQCPSLAKAWASLAAWCYRWGRKAVDRASEEETANLSSEEKSEIMRLLPPSTSASQCQEVTELLNQANIKSMNVGEEDITEQLQSVQDNGLESMRKKLLNVCPELEQTERVILDSLLGIWQQMCYRVYSHYRLAAWAYFTFLQLNGTEKGPNANSSSNNACKDGTDLEKESDTSSHQEDHNVTATLRLLRLLVKHASQFKDVLETGLSTTPTGPWKSIIPQLFSRLNHPEAYVRQSISDLLCRVAQDSPHLIVYQAVVGCADSESRKDESQEAQHGVITKFLSAPSKGNMTLTPDLEGQQHDPGGMEKEPLDNQEEGEEEEEEEEEERNQSLHMMENSLQTILSVLSQHNPTMVTMSKLLVKELRRITLLWEELWLGTLNHVQHDLTRRIAQLEEGVQRIQKNETLSKAEKEAILQEKHKAILKPIVFALEQVELLTSRQAETPNEKLFQQNFSGQIARALTALKQPENLEKPSSCWSLFKQFHNYLNQRANRRAHSFLHLLDISPKLSEIRDSPIPLPGLSCNSGQVLTISSMSNSINILPTKTKPKKLVFTGSDGKRHTYLFKGLEDLHLDERIMQFLTIVNTMFGRNRKSDASLYHACHYSVTPLGPRSGLIQWVDGAFALYGLYKRWQQREAVSMSISKGGETVTAQPPMRPSELYFNKITSALKKEGLSVTTPRKDWPLSLQCEVLDELIHETPEDLLAKELWCSTGGANEWWYLTQSFSRSTAVMSIIGYIIGLGDRHLDNVLVNFLTGEVVHIDYNVCFEKGKNLRIPERVPFRLTQNIQQALGLTGIEGAFRYSCEEVLKILRKGRETLLTLLEAFVYDPLVDWTTGNEGGFAGAFYGGGHLNPVVADGGERRREMEREATRSLFSSKVAELKGEWYNIRDELYQALMNLKDGIEECLGTIRKKEDVSQANEHFSKQLELLQAALKDKAQKHPLFTLQDRWQEVEQIDSTRSQILIEIDKRMRDGQRFYLQHKLALDTVRGQQLNAVVAYLSKPLDLGQQTYVTAAGFLQRAGQGHLVAQYEKLEQELNQAVHQRRKQLNHCMEKLQLYCSVAVKFPENFAEQNRIYVWQGWLQQLYQDMNPDICKRLLQQFQREYSAPSARQVKEILAKEIQLARAATKAKGVLKETNMRGKVELQEMASGGSTRVENLHKQLQKLLQGSSVPLIISPTVLPHILSIMEAVDKMDAEMIGSEDGLYKNVVVKDGPLVKLEDSLHAAENILSLPPLLAEIQDETKPLEKILQCIHFINSSIDQLLLLFSHFEQLWLPEIVELLQEGDRSLQSTIGILNDLIKDCPMGLQEMITAMELSLQSAADAPQITLVEACHMLQAKYQSFLGSFMTGSKSHLAPTQAENLILDMNEHFKLIRDNLEKMILSRESLEILRNWESWNIMKEATSVKTTLITSENLAQVKDLLFLYQVQFTQQVLRAAQQYVTNKPKENGTSSKGKRYNSQSKQSLNNQTAVMEPVKKCIGRIAQKMIVGLGSELLRCASIITVAHVIPEMRSSLPAVEGIAGFVGLTQEHLMKTTVTNNSKSKGELEDAVKELVDAVYGLNRVRHLELEMQMFQELVSRAEGRVVMMQWLYEDVLLTERNFRFQHPARTFVMTGIHREYQQLVVMDRSISSMLEKMVAMQGGISQRLKWAAGANPQVSEVLKTVESSLEHKTTVYQLEAKHSSQLTALSSAILHFEAHRTRTSEAIKSDAAVHDLFKRCDDIAKQRSESTARVSDLEVSLVTMRPPTQEKPINAKWIRGLIDLVKKKMAEGEKLLSAAEVEVNSGKDSLLGKLEPVYGKMSDFHNIVSEVKPHLRSLAQEEEENGEGSDTEFGESAKKFLTDYRDFSEDLASIVKQVRREKGENDANRLEMLSDLQSKMPAFADVMSRIFDSLVFLATPLTTTAVEENTTNKKERSTATGKVDIPRVEVLLSLNKRTAGGESNEPKQDGTPTTLTPSNVATPPPQTVKPTVNAAATPPAGLRPIAPTASKTSPAIMCDPRTGKLIQVRNAHAINVWRRVKGKLDGRDPEPSHRLSVPEQVDFVIREATNCDNLATLYEGWTAWV
ncbi:serine/threonine-protein kinase SMG1-like isoform X2 [Apostichopus japonicus]|uniref:serine/threonine-protein kinase SMG1-like isoform X2 n=1 Tax=Stichopus japonicus TaxID=307972 RepID=UPI003AB491D5